MNVLMLFPDAPDIFFSLTHTLGVLGKKALIPPLGILTVASLLPKDWGKRFVDLHARQPTDEDLAWADYAFISVTAANVQDKAALAVIRRCKQAGLLVVAGGTGFFPEEDAFVAQLKLYTSVDHFVLNEAEINLPLFLADLERGQAKRIYRTDQWADVTQSPIPMWELLNFDDYAQMDVQLIRGCPYDCEFCIIPALMGRPGRAKRTEQFLAELERLYQLGWRGFVEINDDNLIANVKYAKHEFLPALVKWQQQHEMPFRFHVCVDVRVGEDDELLKLFHSAGFHSLFLGIENLDPNCLAEANKVVNHGKDIPALVQRIQKAGILVYCGLMVGFDSDKPTIFPAMMEFLDTCGIVMASLTKVNALPGTRLYRRLKEEGRIDLNKIPGRAIASNILGVTMGDETLHDGYISVMRHLWEPKLFYDRIKTAISTMAPPAHNDKLSLENLKILARIVYFVGIRGEERAYFWEGLLWTLRHYPRHIAIFMSAPALGYGFRRRCEEVFGPIFSASRGREAYLAKSPKRASARPQAPLEERASFSATSQSGALSQPAVSVN
jgi:radical SAM superfamily enzyme YgiQ (UPF0313 family)